MRFVETVMGIPMSIDIRDAGDHSDAAARAFAVLREADARFSVYRPDSEVSAANRGELGPAAFSADLAETIALGEEQSGRRVARSASTGRTGRSIWTAWSRAGRPRGRPGRCVRAGCAGSA
ncbi:FAD:protein FMN transferase [Leifsonia sp. Root227]|uniref:FAD:protein FMN transferase n=1 Tax=Leifsonia sp. Root227 TaxID=1736496 RepID=UPI000A7503C6|nr:FAD:protein FMN transferase [Leifsonia sp. Root227]